jgi:DNA-binding cell septation regulator SpoVG
MSAGIEVLEVRRVDAGNLRAFAKIKLGCVVIHGCRIVQQPGQKAWVALPQTPARKKADGSGAGWFPVVEITRRDVLDDLRDAVLRAWESGR